MTSATKEFTKLRKIFISNGLVEKKSSKRKRLTNKSSKKCLKIIYKIDITWEKERIIANSEKIIKNKSNIKTASSLEQDFHPDWDCFRGRMLYPLSCGELLKLYITRILRNTRKKCTGIMWKIVCFDSKMTLLQKPCCVICLMFKFSSVLMHVIK